MVEAEDKTSAISLADLGLLGEDDATVSVDSSAIKARIAQQAAEAEDDSEKTSAFNVADLPPEDDAPRGPQKTLLGHPAPRPGAAVRGGAAPQKRQETLAIAPASMRTAATAYEDADKTSALSLDDIEKIDQLTAPKPAPAPAPAARAPARPAPKPAAAVDEDEFEKTTAFALDDLDQLAAAPAPKKGSAKAAVVEEEYDEEKTVAVIDEDAIAAMRAKNMAAQRAKRAAEAAVAEVEVDEAPPAKKGKELGFKKAATPAKKVASGGMQLPMSMDAADGFFGSIGHFLAYDGIVAKQNAGLPIDVEPDPDKKAAGLRNIILVGGVLIALMVVFGLVW